MATTAAAKLTPVPADAKAGASPARTKSGGLKPDLSTLCGIALALAGIIGGLILEKGSIQDLTQGTAAMIVFGGTFGAVLVTTPMSIVMRAFRGVGQVFFERSSDTVEVIERLIQFA